MVLSTLVMLCFFYYTRRKNELNEKPKNKRKKKKEKEKENYDRVFLRFLPSSLNCWFLSERAATPCRFWLLR
jgi:hypothetical protein